MAITLAVGAIPEGLPIVMTIDLLFELFFIYTRRTKKPLRKVGFFTNPFLNVTLVLGIIFQLVLSYTFLGGFFHVVPLLLNYWLYILPLSLSGVIIYELIKEFRHKPVAIPKTK